IFCSHLSKVFTAPDVANPHRSTKAHLPEISPYLHGLGVTVENPDSFRAVGQGAGPDFGGTFSAHAISLNTRRVLVDSDDVMVGQKADCSRRHFRKIISCE